MLSDSESRLIGALADRGAGTFLGQGGCATWGVLCINPGGCFSNTTLHAGRCGYSVAKACCSLGATKAPALVSGKMRAFPPRSFPGPLLAVLQVPLLL